MISIIYTRDVDISRYFNVNEYNVIPVLDTRSAVYVATGIAAQNNEKVIVVLNSNNSSRSAFSGMTEAFYRNLPIVLITLGNDLDYTVGLKDVVKKHFTIDSIDKIVSVVNDEFPVHIEVTGNFFEKKNEEVFIPGLKDVLTKEDYLYSSVNVNLSTEGYQCNLVTGGTVNCFEGSLANVLGASLAKKRRRYVGIVTEEEFLHDMNTLGNININDSLMYIILCDSKSVLIENYAKSLGFVTNELNDVSIVSELDDLVNNGKKTVILYRGSQL